MRSLFSSALPLCTLGVLGGLLWMLHVLRLRSRERRLLSIIERMVQQSATPGCGQDPFTEPATPVPVEPASPAGAGVLVVASPQNRDALVRRLEALGIATASADSSWSARVACREALEAGSPYNLVLLDAAACAEDEAGWLSRFEAGLAWGVRVALVKGPSSLDDLARESPRPGASDALRLAAAGLGPAAPDDWEEESVGPHEDFDRRGRAGFATAAAADSPALGLRGPRRE